MIHPCPHAESHYLMASCPCGYRAQGRHTDQGPSAADSGALTSDRRQGAARTVSPVVDHHSERTAPAQPSEDDETVAEWVTCPTCKGEQTIHSRPFDIDITCPECDGDGGWER